MVGPAIARTVFPCGGAEARMILSSAHDRSMPMFFREAASIVSEGARRRAAPDAWLFSARPTFNSGAITAFGALMAAAKTNGWIVLVTAYPSAN